MAARGRLLLLAAALLLLVASAAAADARRHDVDIVQLVEGRRDSPYRSVVLYHGMGDNCCSSGMTSLKETIEAELPGVYVYSVMIGNTTEEDTLAGFLFPMNEQVDYVCELLAADPNLAGGFNAVGLSQGNLFLRAYIQRCNAPPVYNFVSIGGMHQGVFGWPSCLGIEFGDLCEELRELTNLGVYLPEIQDTIVQANYWQDPLQYQFYLANNVFLPDINNQRDEKNAQYVANLNSLNKFAMVRFTLDTVVIPNLSEWWGFYAEGQDDVVLEIWDTPDYKEDYLGLQSMNATGKLDFLSVQANHLDFSTEWFVDEVVNVYLDNTYDDA